MDLSFCFPAVVSSVAMVMDLDSDRVDNGWLFFSAAAGVLLHLAGGTFPPWSSCLAGMLLPVLLLGPFFCFRMLGAGDVKLFCTLGLMLGADRILTCMFVSFLSGGIYVIVRMAADHFVRRQIRAGTIHFTIPICLSIYLHLGGVF
ncbi:MAG: prepilin peptidase [Blautia sp.]|nr:prepilin peptidase [Blautia sp.]